MTRPLLYVSEILPQIDPDLVAENSVDEMVQAGIDRLLSMQTPSGGFGVWPGSSDPVLWGTAYVVHLLHDAKERGYNVPEMSLQEAVSWLDRNAESEPGGPKFRGTHPGYVQYVLALSGKGHGAQVVKLLEAANPSSKDGKELEGQYLLKAALYQTGDHRYAKDLATLPLSKITDERRNGWSYYSDLRRRGMTLSTYHELFGRDDTGTALADLVADGLESQQGSYWTTQELMWGVTGLGKWIGSPPKNLPTPLLSFNGREIAPDPSRTRSDGDVAWQISGASRASALQLSLPAHAEDGLTLVGTTEGVKHNTKLPLGGKGLAVTRMWSTVHGETLSAGSTHDLGDLVYITLELKNTSNKKLENLALVDRIPAGWEIENPRLGRGALPEWADEDGLWVPEYMDIRDDRFQVFGKLERGETVRVVYAVRAVTAGTFYIPAVFAEAMYDGRIWAREAGGTLTIDGGWGGQYL